MQEFYIKKDSVLPILSMELIFDGRHTYNKFHDAIQAADITFTMTNIDNGVIKIANAPCYIKLKENTNCVDEYLICYNWKKRDTKEKGMYEDLYVRICNSGSRYLPFNSCFMDFYNKLQKIDPDYYQMHLEEYVYNKTYKKTR